MNVDVGASEKDYGRILSIICNDASGLLSQPSGKGDFLFLSFMFIICIKYALCFSIFLVLWQANLGFLSNIHLLLGLACVLPLTKNMQSFQKYVQRRDIFICSFIAIVKLCQGQLYSLYCEPTSIFKGDEFWSFCGLLQSDHEQIHLKWVTNYNTCNIEHLAFVLNDQKNGLLGVKFAQILFLCCM